MTTVDFAAGGYRYIPGVFQYSGGVAAMPGFAIRRVRFDTPLPVAAGFAAIARVIASLLLYRPRKDGVKSSHAIPSRSASR
jgi:hypothetical protein